MEKEEEGKDLAAAAGRAVCFVVIAHVKKRKSGRLFPGATAFPRLRHRLLLLYSDQCFSGVGYEDGCAMIVPTATSESIIGRKYN
jgi:hypothetical protein